jgi:curved DNA-binding protein CbpA
MNQPPENSILDLAHPEHLEGLDLEPEEAFVLSRVDGRTTLKQISQILGYEVARVWKLLSRGVESGAFEIKTQGPPPPRAAHAPSAQSILGQLDGEERDPVLSKIPRNKRNEILLRHEARLKQNHYELLGAKPNSTVEEIRSHYFHLVKTLHPDKFFGREMGHYREKLDELFKQVTAAHEELSDADRRKKYDRTIAKETGSKSEKKTDRPKPTGKTLIERLVLAKKYYEMGRHEESAGGGLKAANFFQLAQQFDPENTHYVEALDRNASFILRKRADDAFAKGQEALESADYDGAAEWMEETLKINPKKRECYRKLAIIYWKHKKQLPRARELAEQAVRLFRKDPKSQALLGQILMQMDDLDGAKGAFKEALSLDENNEEAREGLNLLKRK